MQTKIICLCHSKCRLYKINYFCTTHNSCQIIPNLGSGLPAPVVCETLCLQPVSGHGFLTSSVQFPSHYKVAIIVCLKYAEIRIGKKSKKMVGKLLEAGRRLTICRLLVDLIDRDDASNLNSSNWSNFHSYTLNLQNAFIDVGHFLSKNQ